MENKYPIYYFVIKLSQDKDLTQNYFNLHDSPYFFGGLPDNRIWNYFKFYKMFNSFIYKIDKTWLDNYGENYFNNILKEYPDIKNPILDSIEITFVENESWIKNIGYETFDVGQTDEEILKSFKEYSNRKKFGVYDEKYNKKYKIKKENGLIKIE